VSQSNGSDYFFRAAGSMVRMRDFGKQNHNPPLATDRSRAPYAGSQALRDRLQQLVTNGVSERVIDVFKMVEIHEQRRELLVVAASHGYGLYYPVVV